MMGGLLENFPKSDGITDDDRPDGWRSRRRVFLLGKFLLAVGLLLLLYHWDIVRPSDLVRAAKDPVLLVVGGTLTIITIILPVIRWRILLASQGILLGFRDLFHIYYFSVACTPVLPGGVGGDAVRIGYIVRLVPDRKADAAFSVIVDRAIGMAGLVFVPCIAIVPFVPRAISGAYMELLLVAAVFGAAVVAAIFLGLIVARRPLGTLKRLRARFDNRVTRFLGFVLDTLALYLAAPRVVFITVLLSMLSWIFTVLVVAVVAWRLGFSTLSLWDLGVATPLTQLANILPITPGGIGVGEAAFDQLLGILSPAGQATRGFGSVFLVYRTLIILVTLPGLLTHLWFTAIPRCAIPPGGPISRDQDGD
jgi:uncharacterized protein (TIRG00374 family)